MKKFGYFLLGFVPLALCFVLQIGAGFIFAILSKLFMNIPGIGPEKLTYSQWEDMLLSTDANGTLGIIFSLLCILIFGIWYYQTCGGNYLPKPKKTFNTMSVAGTVFIAPGIQFLSSIVLVIIAFVMPKAIEQYQQLLDDVGLTNEITVFLTIYAVIMAPISEELIFRGVTMRCFRKAVPFWLANILQAVLFGVFHGNLVQGIYTAVFALVLGFVCEYGGSIYYSILLHFCYNFWGTIVQQFLMNISEFMYLFVTFFMFISLVVGTLLFIFGQKKLHPGRKSF